MHTSFQNEMKNLIVLSNFSKTSNELEPNQSISYENTYGWIMYKQGKYSDAKIWIEKSLANGSDRSATVLEHYGDVVFHLGDNVKALKDAGNQSRR